MHFLAANLPCGEKKRLLHNLGHQFSFSMVGVSPANGHVPQLSPRTSVVRALGRYPISFYSRSRTGTGSTAQLQGIGDQGQEAL